jgi:glycogen debranching enzyme
MSKEKLTPWFPGNVKPARRGVYEVNGFFSSSCWYSYWNGSWWGWLNPSPADALREKGFKTRRDQDDIKWRGLATRPKAKP